MVNGNRRDASRTGVVRRGGTIVQTPASLRSGRGGVVQQANQRLQRARRVR